MRRLGPNLLNLSSISANFDESRHVGIRKRPRIHPFFSPAGPDIVAGATFVSFETAALIFPARTTEKELR